MNHEKESCLLSLWIVDNCARENMNGWKEGKETGSTKRELNNPTTNKTQKKKEDRENTRQINTTWGWWWYSKVENKTKKMINKYTARIADALPNEGPQRHARKARDPRAIFLSWW